MRQVRVFVHGMGVVTAWGGAAEAAPEALWAALAGGGTAIGPARTFDPTGMPCTTVAAIQGLEGAPDPRHPLAHAAAERADPAGDGVLGVFVGAESGRTRFPLLAELGRRGLRDGRFDPETFLRTAGDLAGRVDPAVASPHATAASLAARFGATGPVETFSQACASGLAAIIEGVRALRAGECDRALVGGVGADADALMASGFGKLGALSLAGVARPFDSARDGFVIGEGAAFLHLSTTPSDVELVGVARGHEAHHLVQPDPSGRPAGRVMAAALADAGDPQVGGVVAHGTGTPPNDLGEGRAIAALLGPRVPVASVKGSVGHLIAGAGALNVVVAVLALRAGHLPPTAGLRVLDPATGVHAAPRALPLLGPVVLTNAFAFGGALSSVVLRSAR